MSSFFIPVLTRKARTVQEKRAVLAEIIVFWRPF